MTGSTGSAEDGGTIARVVAVVRGDVQGVGFRWWAQGQADELGLVGAARNLPDGTVEIDAQGPPEAVDELVDRLRGGRRHRPGTVSGVDVAERDPDPGASGFRTW